MTANKIYTKRAKALRHAVKSAGFKLDFISSIKIYKALDNLDDVKLLALGCVYKFITNDDDDIKIWSYCGVNL